MAFAVASLAQSSDAMQEILTIQQAIQAGNLISASHLIDEALKRHPDDGGLYNLRGVVNARRNEFRQAHQDFAKAVRLEPALTPAWQNLARACQLEAESDSTTLLCAIDAWRRVLRLKDDSEAHSSLALLYEKQGRFSESLRESQRVSAEEASRTGNLVVRCQDLCALGQIDEANAIASQLASHEDFSELDLNRMRAALEPAKLAAVAATLIEGLDRRHAATPASLRRLAIAYEELERPADARKTLERVAIADPKNPAHLLELARLADASKDYEGALGYLAHARDLRPNDPQIHYLFGLIAAKMDLPLEARRSLESALALNPENPAYNYAMGSVILTTRDAATACKYFQKFVQARPADSRGHYALGIAYFASGDYENAERELRRPTNDRQLTGGSEYFLGRIARLEGKLDDAAAHLRQSIAIMPSFSESHTELARIFMDEGNWEAANSELNRAVELDPTSFQGNAQLLVLYRRLRDPRAEKQAEIVKKLDEDRSKRSELMLRTIEVRP
jgi:Flp pilus assembly protein TadD